MSRKNLKQIERNFIVGICDTIVKQRFSLVYSIEIGLD